MWKVNRNVVNVLGFALLGLGAYWFVIQKILEYKDWGLVWRVMSNHTYGFVAFVALQVVLMSINILLECFRWHVLIQRVHKQTFVLSVKQCVGGLAAGAFTPARIGEPIGRLRGLPANLSMQGVSLSLFGSLILNMVIALWGVLALLFVWSNGLQNRIGWIPAPPNSYLFVALLGLASVSMGIYWFKPTFRWFVRRFRLHRILVGFTSHTIFLIVLVTFVRYLTFAFQLAYALLFFSRTNEVGMVFLLIPIYYLLVTVMPSFLGIDLGVRGTVAVVVFGEVLSGVGGIVLSVFVVWLINVALPSLVGFGWMPFRPKSPLQST